MAAGRPIPDVPAWYPFAVLGTMFAGILYLTYKKSRA